MIDKEAGGRRGMGVELHRGWGGGARDQLQSVVSAGIRNGKILG
jgi:hypothetical protein